MAELFTKDYILLWIAAMAAALYFPVYRLIWVLAVRRAEKKNKTEGEAGEALRQGLKKRSMATAALLVFVFSYFYVTALFKGSP